ncbi:MAG: hypothetical protein JO180_08595 [Gemmatirosa sp.]|nr:hypothetical protein [Gemmatirosa sp.]
MPRLDVRCLALALGIVAGCGHRAPKVAAAPSAGPCAGTQSVIVHNPTRAPVDVYVKYGSGAERVLGSAAPGATELGLPPAAGGERPTFQAHALGNPNPLGTMAQGRSDRTRVSFDLVCHS